MNERVTVLLFASLRERAGQRAVTLELPGGACIRELRAALAEAYPALAALIGPALAAINHTYAGDDDLIPPGAQVAFFPPVSGGAHTPKRAAR